MADSISALRPSARLTSAELHVAQSAATDSTRQSQAIAPVQGGAKNACGASSGCLAVLWNPMRDLPLIDVREVYGRHEVLLTGANGFLGKVILGLILDRLPDVKHVHVMVRPRKGLSAEERFQAETVGSPALRPIVYSIREKAGGEFVARKVTTLVGDISQPDCGLAPEDLERLAGRVGLIINCAGLVEFFPPVDAAFSSNVDGVENVIAVAKRLGAKLLQVSTCYVCGEADGLVEETDPIAGFYPHRAGPSDLHFHHADEIALCRERVWQIYDTAGPGAGRDWRDRADIAVRNAQVRSRELTERLTALGRQRAERWGWVNTYTYSKSLGEQIVASEPGLDYAIVRPGIVESALRFPFPGWIEGGRTAAPLVLMAMGGMKEWPMRAEAPLEVVPVDLIAAATLVVGGLLLSGVQKPVYQLGSADANPISLGRLVGLLDEAAECMGRQSRNGIPGRALIDPRRAARVVSLEKARASRMRLEERISRAQSLVAGLRKALQATRLSGNGTHGKMSQWSTALRMLSLQASFREQTLEQYLPFILHNRYIFESENIRAGYSLITEADRRLLPWDPESIDWKEYWEKNQIEGIEKWIRPQATREWTFQI